MPSSQNSGPEALDALRASINHLDQQLLGLLNLRTGLILKVGEIKKQAALAIHVPEREEEILHRLEMTNHGPLQNQHLRAIYTEIFAASRDLQEELRKK